VRLGIRITIDLRDAIAADPPATAARKLALLREALAIVADPAPRQERTVSLLELFAKP
jgi:hypothetical protein